jgi:hypothetical protein
MANFALLLTHHRGSSAFQSHLQLFYFQCNTVPESDQNFRSLNSTCPMTVVRSLGLPNRIRMRPAEL